MINLLARIGIGVVLVLFTACATVKDVQRASDLIRTDNELRRLLTEVRPNDQTGSSVFLSSLAADAKKKAEALGNSADAVAFYRIAATAYWKSDDSTVIDNLFAVVGSGQDVCGALGDKSPDRDCLYLQFVIPFAGLESASNERNYDMELDGINFNDQLDTDKEIGILKDTGAYLQKIKKPVESILKFGKDDVLSSHSELRSYYCSNAKKAYRLYDNVSAGLETKTESYYSKQNELGGSPDLTLAAAKDLRKLDSELPKFCK